MLFLAFIVFWHHRGCYIYFERQHISATGLNLLTSRWHAIHPQQLNNLYPGINLIVFKQNQKYQCIFCIYVRLSCTDKLYTVAIYSSNNSLHMLTKRWLVKPQNEIYSRQNWLLYCYEAMPLIAFLRLVIKRVALNKPFEKILEQKCYPQFRNEITLFLKTRHCRNKEATLRQLNQLFPISLGGPLVENENIKCFTFLEQTKSKHRCLLMSSLLTGLHQRRIWSNQVLDFRIEGM